MVTVVLFAATGSSLPFAWAARHPYYQEDCRENDATCMPCWENTHDHECYIYFNFAVACFVKIYHDF